MSVAREAKWPKNRQQNQPINNPWGYTGSEIHLKSRPLNNTKIRVDISLFTKLSHLTPSKIPTLIAENISDVIPLLTDSKTFRSDEQTLFRHLLDLWLKFSIKIFKLNPCNQCWIGKQYIVVQLMLDNNY